MINRSYVNEYQGSGFAWNSLVTMSNGVLKPIQDMEVGEVVRGPNGSMGVVLAVKKVILGNRQLVAFDNFKLRGAPETPVWAKHPTTQDEWWSSRDMEKTLLDVQRRIGTTLTNQAPLDFTNVVEPIQYGTESGWKTHRTLRIDADFLTPLYELLVDNTEAYYLDGYLVTNNANFGGFDWTTYKL